MVRRGLLFQVWYHPVTSGNSKSMVGGKPGDASVVIGYQVEEFTDTWSVEHLLLNHKFTTG